MKKRRAPMIVPRTISPLAQGALCMSALCVLPLLAPQAVRAQGVPAARQEAAKRPLLTVSREQFVTAPNLIVNPGFENLGSDNLPTGWHWDRHTAEATLQRETRFVHSGRSAISFTNKSEYAAQIYSMLVADAPVRLEAGKPYTLSVWVRSDSDGNAIAAGNKWQFRMRLPGTGGQWRRIAMTFTPGAEDVEHFTRFIIESRTGLLTIDDLKLEAGETATPVAPDPAGEAVAALYREEADAATMENGAFEMPLIASLSRDVRAIVDISIDGWPPISVPMELSAGTVRLAVRSGGDAGRSGPRAVRIRLREGDKSLAELNETLTILSPADIRARLETLRARVPEMDRALASLQSAKLDPSQALVRRTVLANFIDFVIADLDYEKDGRHPFVQRAFDQLIELEALPAEFDQVVARIRAGKQPASARWTGKVRPRIDGPSFLAPAAAPGGEAAVRPVFFTGYGHFGQVKRDIEKMPGYGMNLIQIETGPNRVFTAPDVVNRAPIEELKTLLDRAGAAGVSINLLISPHYFPEWMIERHPELRGNRDGFVKYSLYPEVGVEFLKRYVATVIEPIKDHPALHSICLSNEPVNVEGPGPDQERAWRAWLQKRHGNVANLNRGYRATYASFDAVPLPDALKPPSAPTPVWSDYIRFNQEFFAGWHTMLADAVHAVAPNLPVHAKAMAWTFFGYDNLRRGADAYLFGKFSQINGNDSVNFYRYGAGDFAQDWTLTAMGGDLQRSVKDAPIFNSENHIIPDRETRPVPMNHLRSVLWQAAVHGQSSTTIWAWERTYDPRSDFYGLIMHRPRGVVEFGDTALDLNRAAAEITALQKVKPRVWLLKSMSSALWDGKMHPQTLEAAYRALAFTGLPIGFVEERQLEDGILPDGVLIVPQVSYLSDAAMKTLERFKGTTITIGKGASLSHNEYGIVRRAETAPPPANVEPMDWREAAEALGPHLKTAGLIPDVALLVDGAPGWGVSWQSAPLGGETVVNVCNYRREAVTVSLADRNGKPLRGVDALTGATVDGPFKMAPLETRLLRLRR